MKPVLALASTGGPAIAYVLEARDGFVAFAAADDGWQEERVAGGYFYGPIGLAFDQDGRPHVVYHDHQAQQFVDALGDLVHAVRADGSWVVAAAEDDGHDGWDSTVAVAPDGTVHAAGIDPVQFDREDGVEHYVLGADGWTVTEIGSGPVEYEWNVSLGVTADGRPMMTYFDSNTQDLMFAELTEGSWSLDTVASDGDVGRFSSLAVDGDGTPHVSYFERTGPSAGAVRYATRVDGVWVTEPVGELSDVFIDFAGARRITSLALTADGDPVVAFSDRSTLFVASRGEAGWDVGTVATSRAGELGQLVSLALDDQDVPHLATFEVTRSGPLEGTVLYLTRP